jgi:hypothetical protein
MTDEDPRHNFLAIGRAAMGDAPAPWDPGANSIFFKHPKLGRRHGARWLTVSGGVGLVGNIDLGVLGFAVVARHPQGGPDTIVELIKPDGFSFEPKLPPPWPEGPSRRRLTSGEIVEHAPELPGFPTAIEYTKPNGLDELPEGVGLDDFLGFMPAHNYIFRPTGQVWPAASVNSRIAPITVGKGEDGKPVKIKASTWLDQNQPIEAMTWAPGKPQVVQDKLPSEGGWFDRKGCAAFNLYRPPLPCHGDRRLAGPWLDHVSTVYLEDAEHIIDWLAHRVQYPEDKINHALVLGGDHGIGKDTILEPVKRAVGPWNWHDISPREILGRFNGFVKSVVLRINEARDLGEMNRFQFYDHMKNYEAAPPDVLYVDEKNIREHYVSNVCGVVITTNHKADGIYLPREDRRHYVAWSSLKQADFSQSYWDQIWGWYDDGGIEHVTAFLAARDISSFHPKAPPMKTPAFWDIVNASRAPEEGELTEAFEHLEWPNAVVLGDIITAAHVVGATDFADWLRERKNRRQIPHRLEACGYVPVRNPDDKHDGQWNVKERRQTVYAKTQLTYHQQLQAVRQLQRGLNG